MKQGCRTGPSKNCPTETWWPDVEVIKATIRFLGKTGRLTYQPLDDEATIGMDYSHF
jgi:hypothetical protein